MELKHLVAAAAALMAAAGSVCALNTVDFDCRAQLKKDSGDWLATEDDLTDTVFHVKGYALDALHLYQKGTKITVNTTTFRPLVDTGFNLIPDTYFDVNRGLFSTFTRKENGEFLAVMEWNSRLSKLPVRTTTYKGTCKPLR